MSPKKLEPKSRYAALDFDQDGVVSDEELARHQEIIQLELQEEKANSQRKMAWTALVSILIVTFLSFFVVEESRLKLLSDVINMFYLSMASIVGAYVGFATLDKKV